MLDREFISFAVIGYTKTEGLVTKLAGFMKFTSKIKSYEERTRNFLLKYPTIYTVLAAVCIILFWEGVTEVAGGYHFLTGPVLLVITTPILVVLGVLLPFFVNDKKLLNTLKHEEEEVEKVEAEEEESIEILKKMSEKIDEMDQEIHGIEREMEIKK